MDFKSIFGVSVTSLSYKKILSFVLILVLALATGFSVGKLYVDSLGTEAVVSANEEQLREKDETVEALHQRSLTSSPENFSALELYLIAEYNLNHAENFYKEMTGTVNALVVEQKMKSIKVKNGDILLSNKYSPGSTFVADICTQTIYNYQTNEISINQGTFVDTSVENMKGNFDPAAAVPYTMEEYKEAFNTTPSSVMSYIISSITCQDENFSAVTKNQDGTYSFSITLEGDRLSLAALYYSYEIKFSSGLAKAPSWVSLKMDVTVDENFNFKTIGYDEVYKMSHPLAGSVTVVDDFDEFYLFENVPSIEEVA